MNLLLDELPKSISVNGQVYHIKTCFRNWIEFEKAMTDSKADNAKKFQTICNIFEKDIPDDLNKAIDELVSFYQCGSKEDPRSGKRNSYSRCYDYEIDQFPIFTSFLQYYKIDLTTADLHWWIFKQLFVELPDESKVKKIMMYRTVKINSKMSSEQKSFYAEMKRLYALPSNGIKPKSFGAILANGMHIKE